MKVFEILEFLNKKYPLNTAMDFDNVGLLVGDSNKEITKAMVALDCTIPVIKNAVKNGCQLIITHHPVIFGGLKTVLDNTVVFEVLKNNLTVISMHTNLDQCDGGVNDCLCEAIGLKNVETVVADDGYLLKKGMLDSPLSADRFASYLKLILGYPTKYVGENDIKNVLVCGGSGGDYYNEVLKHNCDALVTADIKHHLFLEASLQGISLFECGHFNTEVVVIKPLAKMLKAEIPEIEFFINTESFIKTAE